MPKQPADKSKDIINAAIAVFAGNGYQDAKIAGIAGRAGVATGSVYLHFQSKADLLETILMNVWQELADLIQDISSNGHLDPLEKTDVMVDTLFDYFSKNAPLTIVLMNEHVRLWRSSENRAQTYYNRFIKAAREIFKDGINQDFMNPDLDVPSFMEYLLGGLLHLNARRAANPRSISLTKARQNIKYQIKHGILKW